MKRILAASACAVASVALSACGSSQPVAAPVAAHYHGGASLTFVADAPSTGLGVENTDIYAATTSGSVRDITATPAGETDAAWSADGRHVVFIRHWTTARSGGRIAVHNGVFAWSPGHGRAREIAACGRYCERQDFAWSPDDSRIAFTEDEPNAIEVMNADGSHRRTICGGDRCGGTVEGPVWSPDGRRLVFSNSPYGFGPVDPPGAVWIANADGSGVRKLTQPSCDLSQWQKGTGCAIDASPAWSPSGSLIAFSRRPVQFQPRGGERVGETEIEVMRSDGSRVHTLVTCHGPYCLQDLQPTWSPTGTAITWVRVGKNNAVIQLTTLAGRTSTLRTCARSRCVDPGSPTWSPDGKQLAFFGGGISPGIWTIQSDGTSLRHIADGADWCCLAWIGRATLPGQTPQGPGHDHPRPHLSGTVAYDTDEGQAQPELRLLSLVTGRTTAIRIAPSMVVQPSWSPDGREIAFAAQRGNENTNIYVARRNGSHLTELTHFHSGATEPAWSPKGGSIAFETDAAIGLIASDGRVRTLVAKGSDPSWAPDGRRLVFDRALERGEIEALFTIRPDGTGLYRLTHLPGLQRYPAWSPDGREIAFDWYTPGGESLYLIRPDGTHLRRVTSQPVPDGRPAWSPDGRYLLLLPNTNGGSSVEVIDVRTGRVTTLTAIPDYAADPSWTSR